METAIPYTPPVPDYAPVSARSGWFRRALAVTVPLVLAAWFGSLVTLIVMVASLFSTARRVALDAAPALFHIFERYQLVLAAVSLLTLTLWRFTALSWLKTLATAAAIVATALAGLQIGYITPKINALRDVDHEAFERFHHYASMNYSTIAGLVLIAAVLAVIAGRREA